MLAAGFQTNTLSILLLKYIVYGFVNNISAVPVDVIGIKPYMDSLFDPSCVPVRVMHDQ